MKKQLTEKEVDKVAARTHLKREQIEIIKAKFEVKNDFDKGKEADI